MLIRAIVRIAAGMFAWRMATARRGAAAAAPAGRMQEAGAAPGPLHLDARHAAARLRDAASLSWRVFAGGVLLTATALLVTGGVTLTVLSPRWLGIVLLVLAGAALFAAAGELLAVRRMIASRRFRRRAEALRREVG